MGLAMSLNVRLDGTATVRVLRFQGVESSMEWGFMDFEGISRPPIPHELSSGGVGVRVVFCLFANCDGGTDYFVELYSSSSSKKVWRSTIRSSLLYVRIRRQPTNSMHWSPRSS
jgi:hypothetical protein